MCLKMFVKFFLQHFDEKWYLCMELLGNFLLKSITMLCDTFIRPLVTLPVWSKFFPLDYIVDLME